MTLGGAVAGHLCNKEGQLILLELEEGGALVGRTERKTGIWSRPPLRVGNSPSPRLVRWWQCYVGWGGPTGTQRGEAVPLIL